VTEKLYKVSHSESSTKCGNLSRWNWAISKAEELLELVEEKAKRLRTHIAWMKESRDAGEPWSEGGKSVTL
jgi:hypothetical protein